MATLSRQLLPKPQLRSILHVQFYLQKPWFHPLSIWLSSSLSALSITPCFSLHSLSLSFFFFVSVHDLSLLYNIKALGSTPLSPVIMRAKHVLSYHLISVSIPYIRIYIPIRKFIPLLSNGLRKIFGIVDWMFSLDGWMV